MKFGPVPTAQAEGAVLAHALQLAGGKLKKGHLLQPEDIAALQAEGVADVIVARLEADDVAENLAATGLAHAIVPDEGVAGLSIEPAFTGRVNLRAKAAGILRVEAEAIAAINAVDPMITLACLPTFQRVTAGMMVATVKIIPYAVPQKSLNQACDVARNALSLIEPVITSARLILSEVAGQKPSLNDKAVSAIGGRLDALGVVLTHVETVPHTRVAMAAAIKAASEDLVLVLTASATSDIEDVMPGGLCDAGGQVIRFGMPVDPGNLLVLGRRDAQSVIGLPGCARSPALNGADWVLERVICGVPLGSHDIAAMGVGGLLKEIPTRPQPREGR